MGRLSDISALAPFTKETISPTLKQIKSNDPGLTSVHLSNKKITNKQLVTISDALEVNTCVTELWLTDNLIRSEGEGSAGAVGYLMSVLEGHPTVAEVYLSGNKMGTDGVTAICSLLRVNSVITDLGLEDNGICDSGAQMLLDAIRQNTTLQTLKLSGNNIQVQSTVRSINELLGNNREAAKKRFEEDHPELVTHKLKKPGKKKESKRGEKSKSRRSERKSSRRVGDENACERKDRLGRKEGLDGKDRSKEKESSYRKPRKEGFDKKKEVSHKEGRPSERKKPSRAMTRSSDRGAKSDGLLKNGATIV